MHSGGGYERELLWHDNRAMLLDVHDNVVDILNLYCIELLLILERYEDAARLRHGVLEPMERRDYYGALDNLRDFVLENAVMYKLFPELVDRAEPGLDILRKLADEYELH